jgi:hypothetical protein
MRITAMRFDIVILFALFIAPILISQALGREARAQTTYPISARVPATCPKGYSPNVETGLCPVSCPSNTAANTNRECVPLPVVQEEPALLAPRPIDAPTAVDPANTATCTDGRTWDAVLMRCEP